MPASLQQAFCLLVPQGGLHLADVGLAQQQHAQAALADAAADGQGQLAVQQHLVEGQLPAVVAAGFGELRIQGLRVHPDAHGGDLQGALQGIGARRGCRRSSCQSS